MLKTTPKLIHYDLWLLGIFFLNFVDLFTTYVVLTTFSNSSELSPLYNLGGWSLFFIIKVIFPFLLYYLSRIYKDLIFLKFFAYLLFFVSFWNIYLLFINIF